MQLVEPCRCNSLPPCQGQGRPIPFYDTITTGQISWCSALHEFCRCPHKVGWLYHYATTLSEHTHVQYMSTQVQSAPCEDKPHNIKEPSRAQSSQYDQCQLSMADQWHATKVCNVFCAAKTPARILWGAEGVPLLRVRPDAPTLWGNRNTLTSSLVSNSLMAALACKSTLRQSDTAYYAVECCVSHKSIPQPHKIQITHHTKCTQQRTSITWPKQMCGVYLICY
jgi:hypothetical protein